ncbi:MAG: NAD+ synthase [Nitrospinae bacterium CG11_big_fil_rev_8_21_14_0_20_56_8]|nr:MAG: NAD+ synthase [Nitrospinae bacterium CG11_big_fil_rev_8_21_14_0_20_56_8]
MKIALAQINPIIGDFEGNLERIQSACTRAGEEGADLVALPELAVSGYPPRDLLDCPEFVLENQRTLDRLVKSVSGPAVLCGTLLRVQGHGGKDLANGAVLFRNGSILAETRKILLPTYDVFDELRYFRPGDTPLCFDLDGIRLGITICEDIWNFAGFYDEEGYSQNPVEKLASKKIDVLINISASPYRVGHPEKRRLLGRKIATTFGIPFVLVNQIGGNDDLLFDGYSFALSASGEIAARAMGFREDLVVFDLENCGKKFNDVRENEEEEVLEALSMGVKDYLHKCGFKKAVIGLSGGIDSSLVAVIAARALGPENVTGISMPSPYTAQESIDHARRLAENLGIAFHIVPISSLFETYKSSLASLFEGFKEDVTEENIQARIRGNILMAVSNKMGWMVLSTGNKSEVSVGYCTLYGDMAGGLAVISDVPKTRVYALARWINREREIIPHPVLVRAPTAELRPNQTDQDSLPPYDVLDSILEGYVENRETVEQIAARGFPLDLVADIVRKIDRNEYKRSQAPPGLKISRKAFGSGRRKPIVHRFISR